MEKRITLCNYDRLFLKLSYIWLTDPEIRALTDTPEITEEEQECWFNSLEQRSDYKVWGVRCNDMPIGVCGIKNIEKNKGEYFGYIGEKSYWGGTGRKMMEVLEKTAIDLGLKILTLKVLKWNTRAICLYRAMKYNQISADNRFIYMSKNINL